MSEPLTDEQAAEVAVRHGIDPDLGRELLAGQDRPRAEALAAATAATRSNPIAMLVEHKRRKDTATLAALGIAEEPPAEDASDGDAPDWDGGVRQPAPIPSDPEQEHNELLLNVLAAKRNRPRGDY